MASVNKVIVVGNLGKDPDTRYAESGDCICNFSVATSDRWKDKTSGEMKEQTEWHRISAFGKLAEICDKYLRKGSQVYVEGSLRTRKWTDKEGNDRYITEIRASAMQMLGKRGGDGDYADESDRRPAKGSSSKDDGGLSEMDEDIPF